MKKFNDFRFSEKTLSKQTRDVMYHDQTEPPFNNSYNEHWAMGIYVDPSNGEALFSAYDKYACLCGWPAFYQPIIPAAVQYLTDHSFHQIRTEVRTSKSNLHLGHVFADLDSEVLALGYQRYCINSAALKFVSEKEIMESEHEPWIKLWKTSKAENHNNLAIITLAGGCFWGVQHLLKHVSGVYKTTVGYANANANAHYANSVTYKQVCSGQTGATEAVQVFYNKKLLSLDRLLDVFFAHVDPTTWNRQGPDVGSQYRSGVYFSDLNDLVLLQQYFEKKLAPRFDKPIVCELEKLTNYFLAEEEHQDYLVKNPNGYCHIRF